MSALDKQVGGDHYKKYVIQPIEFFIANNIPYAEAAIIKYVLRYQDKNGIEDLEKAKHLIEILIEVIKKDQVPKIPDPYKVNQKGFKPGCY
jgi:hypothetical protein